MSRHDDEVLSISVSQTDEGVVVVALTGELDMATADQLRSALDRVGSASRAVLDLSGLQFIDSTGLNELALRSRSAAGQGGLLVVAGAPPHVKKVFEVVQLEDSVSVEVSVADALARAQAHSPAN